jgi:hypothetical protein
MNTRINHTADYFIERRLINNQDRSASAKFLRKAVLHRLASILLHLLTEFSNSTDLPNEGLAPIPRRQASPDIDRPANDGVPREWTISCTRAF